MSVLGLELDSHTRSERAKHARLYLAKTWITRKERHREEIRRSIASYSIPMQLSHVNCAGAIHVHAMHLTQIVYDSIYHCCKTVQRDFSSETVLVISGRWPR